MPFIVEPICRNIKIPKIPAGCLYTLMWIIAIIDYRGRVMDKPCIHIQYIEVTGSEDGLRDGSACESCLNGNYRWV